MSQYPQIAVMTPEQVEALIERTTERALAAVADKRPAKKLLTSDQVEKEYGIPRRNLEAWRHIGLGPQYTTVGRRVYYERDILEAYIAAGRVKTCAEGA